MVECQEQTLSSKAASIAGLDITDTPSVASLTDKGRAKTESHQALVPLSFKVTKAFKKRYQQTALDADMKLNELLSAMLDLWENSRKPTS